MSMISQILASDNAVRLSRLSGLHLLNFILILCSANISVNSNIAEGSSRSTKKDQTNFYTMAFSSLMEVSSQVILSCDLAFITDNQYNELRNPIEEISKQLNALRNEALNP